MTAKNIDDINLTRAAAIVSRDLACANPKIYWIDLLLSALVTYGSLILAVQASSTGWMLLAMAIGCIAFHRSSHFIHEVAHLREGTVPGFRLGWNFLIGIPFFMPSLIYEEMHLLHHNRIQYGTRDDPEYYSAELIITWRWLVLFVAAVFLLPILCIRFSILTPISLAIPPLRRFTVMRFSSLSANPYFRRRPPEGLLRKNWYWQEAGCCLWATILLLAIVTDVLSLRAVGIICVTITISSVAGQLRALVSHLWENNGEQMTVTEQFLDSVDVSPPNRLIELFSPIGLRYHATHHLMPSLPYHALPEAHRRLKQMLPERYAQASYPGVWILFKGLFTNSARRAAILPKK